MSTLAGSPLPARHRPPGPRGHPLVGSLPEFARDVLGFFTACSRDHGDLVFFRLAASEVFFLQNPQDIETVLLTQRGNFIKHTFFFRHVTAIFGNGLLTSEGDFWLRQRRLAAPAFHPDRIAGYGNVMASFADRLAGRWRSGEVRDVYRDLLRATMEIVSKTLFDSEVAEEIDEIERSFDRIIREIAKRFRRPFRIPDAVPTPGNLRYRSGVARLDGLVRGILGHRRAQPGDRGDLLSMLLAARDEDGRPMSDKQVRDEVVTLFIAGHETTAIALSWALVLLAGHPEVDERLWREVSETLGDRLPCAADLPRLPYVEAVVKESLRLYPPAYVIGREALADCALGGYTVPARATIYFSPWVLHRDSRWFEEPERFRPERWLDDSMARLPKYAFLPFGGGPRVCIGERFAMMETVLVLAALLRRFRFEPAGPDPLPFPSVTLRPDRPVLMRLAAR
jgi:cytochrome P450